jgi:two-component system sensor kinase FixL
MGEMTAALAHELNQPLGAAANFLNAARIALAGDDPDGRTRAMWETKLRAGAILRRLRSFVSHGDIDKRIVPARPLVEDAVALALVGARDPDLRTRLAFADDLSILVDGIQIQQVVFNLVKNALEATERRHPREIEVATRARADSEVEISVADNGPGLPEDPDMLFRPFATTKADGLGVGLSICRAIVEAHGGRLWAEPREGGGAVFLFTVPTAPTKEVTDDERAHHPSGG